MQEFHRQLLAGYRHFRGGFQIYSVGLSRQHWILELDLMSVYFSLQNIRFNYLFSIKKNHETTNVDPLSRTFKNDSHETSNKYCYL